MSSDGAVPTTQKAWMVVKQGKPRNALVLKTDVPVPKPKKGEVLVRVRAAALNPVCVLSSALLLIGSYMESLCPMLGFGRTPTEGGRSWIQCRTYYRNDPTLQNMILQVSLSTRMGHYFPTATKSLDSFPLVRPTPISFLSPNQSRSSPPVQLSSRRTRSICHSPKGQRHD